MVFGGFVLFLFIYWDSGSARTGSVEVSGSIPLGSTKQALVISREFEKGQLCELAFLRFWVSYGLVRPVNLIYFIDVKNLPTLASTCGYTCTFEK
ncbi:hypothetical protein NBRC116587_27500 [Pseudoteredinibacter isoporae]